MDRGSHDSARRFTDDRYTRPAHAIHRKNAASTLQEDLGITEVSVLGSIDRGIALPSAISRDLHLDPGRVTRIVDLLVRLDYVQRGYDLEDRRRCPLSLTPTGWASLNTARRSIAGAIESIVDQLLSQDRQGLVDGLEAVRGVLEAPAG